jgi:hypothetical protein
LKAIKLGSRTLIDVEHGLAYLATIPGPLLVVRVPILSVPSALQIMNRLDNPKCAKILTRRSPHKDQHELDGGARGRRWGR